MAARDTSDHLWDQLYLKRIQYADYTDRLAGGTEVEKFLVSISFVYEERPDPFSDYRAGFEIRTARRCVRIEVSTHAGSDQLTRTYHLIYLDQRENTFCIPLNRCSSILSGVAASYVLVFFLKSAAPSAAQLAAVRNRHALDAAGKFCRP